MSENVTPLGQWVRDAQTLARKISEAERNKTNYDGQIPFFDSSDQFRRIGYVSAHAHEGKASFWLAVEAGGASAPVCMPINNPMDWRELAGMCREVADALERGQREEV